MSARHRGDVDGGKSMTAPPSARYDYAALKAAAREVVRAPNWPWGGFSYAGLSADLVKLWLAKI